MQALKEVSGPEGVAECVRKIDCGVDTHPTADLLLQAFLCCSPSWWCGQMLNDADFPESEQLWEGSTFTDAREQSSAFFSSL